MEKFANVTVNFKACDVHTFGCPMYVLQTAGQLQPKWDAKARLAVYLGPSLNHARSVGLALSLQSGLVSPVFHARYDDRFNTVAEPYGKYITKSQWQFKCGFTLGVPSEAWIEQSSPPTKMFNTHGFDQHTDRITDTAIPTTDSEADIIDTTELTSQQISPPPSMSSSIDNTTNITPDVNRPPKGAITTRSG
jgi:hypothetical protein